jgi:hypothetical protein
MSPRCAKARLRLMKRLEQLILQLGDISEIVARSHKSMAKKAKAGRRARNRRGRKAQKATGSR